MKPLALLPLVPLLTLSFFAASCATTGTANRTSRLEQAPVKLQRGTTHSDAVRELLGDPKRRELGPSGERWLYGSAARQSSTASVVGDQLLSTGIGMIPYAGGAINSLRHISRATRSQGPGAWVDFDQRGIVRDYLVDLN